MSSRKSLNVLAITNVPVPYRVDFFNDLNKQLSVTVLYEQTPKEQTHRSEEWFSDNSQRFDFVYLKKESDSVKFKDIIQELKNQAYDISLVMGYTKKSEIISILWLKLHHKPYLLSVDGGFIKRNEFFLKRILKKFLISGASGYLSTGVMTDEYLKYYGAAKEKIYRIPFTSLREEDILDVPISIEQKTEIRAQLGMLEKKVIISVGQFIYRKGYDLLLNACIGLNKDIGIYIIGSEPTDEFIAFQKKNNLTNVHFVGFKKKDELKKYYFAADLFVLPTREDIWGLVINEALAFGLPVITTDKCIAGVELVNSNNGEIIPAENIAALRDSINKLIDNPDKIQTMSKISIKIARKFTIEEMARVHYKIIMKVFEENNDSKYSVLR